jgi:hypothetical protein
MDYDGFRLSQDELAVLDHVSGLTRVLPAPCDPACEDREYVGELVAMRSKLGAMAIQAPKMHLTFDDILKAAEEESAQPTDNRIIYWLTGRWGIGLVTAASVALAFMTGLATTSGGGIEFFGLKQVEQFPVRDKSRPDLRQPDALSGEQIAEPPPPEYPQDNWVDANGDNSRGQDLKLYGSIVRQGSVHLRHADPASVQRLVTELVTSSGGMVTNLTRQGSGDYTSVLISVAVPADKYRDFKGKVAGYGEVLNETESTEDVTSEQVDFKARLAEAEDYLTRLDKLIETPTDLSSLQNLERERRNTRLEIERYRKAIQSLESRVALSRLDIEITTAAPEAIEPGSEMGRAFKDGLEGLETVGAFLIKAGLAGSPFLAIGAIAYIFLRRKRKQIERKAA